MNYMLLRGGKLGRPRIRIVDIVRVTLVVERGFHSGHSMFWFIPFGHLSLFVCFDFTVLLT